MFFVLRGEGRVHLLGAAPSQLTYVVVYTVLDRVTVAVADPITGDGGEVKVAVSEEEETIEASEVVVEAPAPNARASALNASKVLPFGSVSGLMANTIPLKQCTGGPFWRQYTQMGAVSLTVTVYEGKAVAPFATGML